jgi:hypothetical protein
MSKKIEDPAECEVRAVIRFLNAQYVRVQMKLIVNLLQYMGKV